MNRVLSEDELLELVELVRFYAWQRYEIDGESDMPFMARLLAASVGLDQNRIVADYGRGRLLEATRLIASLDTVPRLEDHPGYQPAEEQTPEAASQPRTLRQLYKVNPSCNIDSV